MGGKTIEIDRMTLYLHRMYRWRCLQAVGMTQHPSISLPSLRARTPKMEGDYHGQRGAAWFLWKEGIKPIHIHPIEQ